jgi:hypothetical protein
MSKKKKAGRPKLPKAQSRQPGFSLRLLPNEHEEIKRAITRSTVSKTEWIRNALLEKARREK